MPSDNPGDTMIRFRRWTQVLCLVLFAIIFFHFSLPDGSKQLPRPHSNPPPPSPNVGTSPVGGTHKVDTPSNNGANKPKPNTNAGGTTNKDPLRGQDDPSKPQRVHWQKSPEHFPVPQHLLITLPTSAPKTPIGRIQASTFPRESEGDRNDRLKKRQVIREALEHSWKGYKEHAWGRDEVGPLSGTGKDNFGGWAATLVDALDTLWIMDMKTEFEEAVEYVHKIDFTVYESSQIRVFETIIRFLGGLIGAYDISGQKYPILLEKAIEVGDVVFGAFDTPNRIPVLYYEWAPEAVARPRRASAQTGLAELGTLMLEYTRLAQLTGNQSYYDAVQRITDDLESIQYNSSMPGFWPGTLDGTGGCAGVPPVAPRPITFNPGNGPKGRQHAKRGEDTWRDEKQEQKLGDDAKKPKVDDPQEVKECIAGGLSAKNVPYGVDEFTYGAGSDSFYEYLIKMHLLLGGATEQYAKLYKSSMEVGKQLLYRPMLPGNPDVLLAGKILAKGEKKSLYFRSETGHLTCFAGGMFAVGSRALDIKEHMSIGSRLTDGCVTVYGITKSGIMPEALTMYKCPDETKCEWDEIAWMKLLAPSENWDLIAGRQTSEAASTTSTVAAVASPTPLLTGSKTTNADIVDEVKAKHDEDKDKPIQNGVWSGNRNGEPKQYDADHPDPFPHDPNHPVNNKRQLRRRSASPADADADAAKAAKDRVKAYIDSLDIPPGVTEVNDRKYMLRPEAIESVFIMYRITGDEAWRKKGWEMWLATDKAARTELAYAQVADVMREVILEEGRGAPVKGQEGRKYNRKGVDDNMESFWFAETLKYYYLLFSEPELVSLDDYVLNTEAHPFKRKKFD